ncbi:biotin/lipoyl-binding protein, partial [Paenibacillus popilliae]
GEIDIVVKAKGVIKTSEKVTRITNKVLGEVELVHYTDGQKVKQGDILYSLKKTVWISDES